MDWSKEVKRIPDWYCKHDWVNRGVPFRTWTSNSTGGECPDGVPWQQDQICTRCGGIQTIILEGVDKT
jgi:hypothetical protein